VLDLILSQKINAGSNYVINEVDVDCIEVYKLGEIYINGLQTDIDSNAFINQYQITRLDDELIFSEKQNKQ